MSTFRKTNKDYEEFKRVANANDMLKGIENISSIDDDEAYELAQILWLETAASTNDSEDQIFSFIEYLETIKERCKGFVYELARLTLPLLPPVLVTSTDFRPETGRRLLYIDSTISFDMEDVSKLWKRRHNNFRRVWNGILVVFTSKQ